MIDRMYQFAYSTAYKMMRVYWAVRRPKTHGALVGLWYEGHVLLVRNSYLKYYGLPGGYVRPNETAKRAAVRELAEEVNIALAEDELQPSVDIVHEWEGKHDHVEIFSAQLSNPPRIEVDNREVVEARLYTPEAALRLNLFPPVRQHIEKMIAKRS